MATCDVRPAEEEQGSHTFSNPMVASSSEPSDGGTSSIGGSSSSREPRDAGSSRGHLRKMTAALVDILEQMSGSVMQQPAGGAKGGWERFVGGEPNAQSGFGIWLSGGAGM